MFCGWMLCSLHLCSGALGLVWLMAAGMLIWMQAEQTLGTGRERWLCSGFFGCTSHSARLDGHTYLVAAMWDGAVSSHGASAALAEFMAQCSAALACLFSVVLLFTCVIIHC